MIIKKVENENKIIYSEIIQSEDHLSKSNDLMDELSKLSNENEKLNKESVLNKDSKTKLIKELRVLKEKLIQTEQNLQVIEIEKEEIYEKCEKMEHNYENELKSSKILKKLLSEKDKEIKRLNQNLEELNEKLFKLNIFNYEVENTEENENLNIINENQKSLTKTIPINNQNYESCLNSICPEFDDIIQDSDYKLNIAVTTSDVIRRMSRKESNYSPAKDYSLNYLSTQSSKSQTQNDIYKDFFMLTYQSFKLNTEDIELFKKIHPEILYKKITTGNIPFHKFYQYIKQEITKKK